MADPDRSRERAQLLRSELAMARAALDRLAAEAARAAIRFGDSTPEVLDVYGAGALLHAYYVALERLLRAVARDFNASPAAGPEWHRRLLALAATERAGVRPAVLSPGLLGELDGLLRFRHVFRNMYVFELRWDELLPLLRRLASLHPRVAADIEAFDGFLAALGSDGGPDPAGS